MENQDNKIRSIVEEVKNAVASFAGSLPQGKLDVQQRIKEVLKEMPSITDENLNEYIGQTHTFTIVGNRMVDLFYQLLVQFLLEFVSNEILSYTSTYKINNFDLPFLFKGKMEELQNFTVEKVPTSYKALLYRYAIGFFLLNLNLLEE